jgi:RNA polymerase sigma factor (sigma-70 family)
METRLALVESESQTSQPETNLFIFRPQHTDDSVLWKSFRDGDEKAFITIFDKMIKPLYAYGLRFVNDGELVKDAIQELFIEIWKNRERLGETNSIKFYLLRSLRRKLFRIKTANAKITKVSLTDEILNETAPSPESAIIVEQSAKETDDRIAILLAGLTLRQREAIHLRYFEEMEYNKIAAVMDLTKQAVYNLIHKAIDSLKKSSMVFSLIVILWR